MVRVFWLVGVGMGRDYDSLGAAVACEWFGGALAEPFCDEIINQPMSVPHKLLIRACAPSTSHMIQSHNLFRETLLQVASKDKY